MVPPDGRNCVRVKIGYVGNFEFGEDCVQLFVGILKVDAYAVPPVGTLLGAPRRAYQEFFDTHRKKVNQEREGRGKKN